MESYCIKCQENRAEKPNLIEFEQAFIFRKITNYICIHVFKKQQELTFDEDRSAFTGK